MVKRSFVFVTFLIVFLLLINFGCENQKKDSSTNNSNDTTIQKFDLRNGELYTELCFDTVEKEMFETFKFKDLKGLSKEFYVSYNIGGEWLDIEKRLIKNEKYTLIYKPFSNQKIIDSLQRNNIMTDDFPPSGDYICYIEDAKGQEVFKSKVLNSISISNKEKNSENLDKSTGVESSDDKTRNLVNEKISNKYFYNDEKGLYTVIHFEPVNEGAPLGAMILSQMKCHFSFSYEIIGNKIKTEFVESGCGRTSSNRTFFYDEVNDYIYMDNEGQKFIFTEKP